MTKPTAAEIPDSSWLFFENIFMTQFPHLWCTIFCQDILNIWQSAHFKHCNSYFHLQVKWSGADGPDWVELQHWNNSQKKYVLSQSCCNPTLCMQYSGLENTPRCIFQNHTQHLATFTPAYCSFFSHTQYLATFTPAYCRFFSDVTLIAHFGVTHFTFWIFLWKIM